MSAPDRFETLIEANAARRKAALSAGTEAIERLSREGRAITFASVATTARVSRAWLYRQDEMRAAITALRGLAAAPAAPVAQRASLDSLRRRLEASNEEITRLRSDNTALRHQLARHLGNQRARRTQPRNGETP